MAEHRFEANEVAVLRRSLEWLDRSDSLLAATDVAADSRERGALLKQSMDASATGLRFWRLLKIHGSDHKRRPGRPSGDGWTAQRREQAASRPKAV